MKVCIYDTDGIKKLFPNHVEYGEEYSAWAENRWDGEEEQTCRTMGRAWMEIVGIRHCIIIEDLIEESEESYQLTEWIKENVRGRWGYAYQMNEHIDFYLEDPNEAVLMKMIWNRGAYEPMKFR